MKVILGGAAQGKLAYVKERYPQLVITDGADCPPDAPETCAAVDHFHLWLRRILEEDTAWEMRPEELAERIFERNPDLVIITDEIGAGMVPVDAADRRWREFTGRVCTCLCRKADLVVRIVMGIPMILKQEGGRS